MTDRIRQDVGGPSTSYKNQSSIVHSKDGQEFCEICQSLVTALNDDSGEPWINYTFPAMERNSASGCMLCAMIIQALKLFLTGFNAQYENITAHRSSAGLLGLHIPLRDIPLPTIEVFTLPDTQTLWPAIPVGNALQGYTASKVYLDKIRPWIHDCVQNHDLCRASQSDFFPTRVLDVGTGNSEYIRLVENESRQLRGHYICLSHCWGSSRPLRTTVDVMLAHTAGIPMRRMPPTFRDAVMLARFIGVRYLWIDSLCIIQDDEHDWVAQSSQMGDIYSSSLLTTSAAVSKDANSGIFRPSVHGAGHVEIPDSTALGVSTGLFARKVVSHAQFSALYENLDGWDSHAAPEETHPLLARAWAYQEQLLSPRVLLFGHREIFWSYNQRNRCCCSQRSVSFGYKPAIAQTLRYSASIHPNIVLDLFTAWRETARNSRYLAGLWEDKLVEDLCWRVPGGNGKRPKEYIGPSWSWTSVLGSIDWSSDFNLNWVRTDVVVLEASCTLSSLDSTGAVDAGLLRLSGCLLPGTLSFEGKDSPSSLPKTLLYINNVGYDIALDACDDDFDSAHGMDHPVYGLRVGALITYADSAQRGDLREFMIILHRTHGTDSSAPQYKRVGYVKLWYPSIASDVVVENQEINII